MSNGSGTISTAETSRPGARIYLAGPTVFRRDAAEEGGRLKALCAAAGCEGLYPLDMPPLPRTSPGADAAHIRKHCLALLDRADCVVADLSPFRGPHVDDGTAFELGYAHALGKPVFGYTRDPRPLVERIDGDATGRDADGYLIEAFGEPFNVMIAATLMNFAPDAEAAILAAARWWQRAEGPGTRR